MNIYESGLSITAILFVITIQFVLVRLVPIGITSEYHLLRRFQHSVSGIALILCYNYLLSPLLSVITLIIVDISLFFLHCYRCRNPAFNQWFIREFRLLLRDHEKTQLPGAFYMLFGCLLCLSLHYYSPTIFPIDYINLVMLFISIGDPVAGFIGKFVYNYGIYNPKIYNGKTLFGSMGMLLCCTIISYSYLHCTISESLFYGLIGALSELFSIIDDNLFVPLISLLTIAFYSNIKTV